MRIKECYCGSEHVGMVVDIDLRDPRGSSCWIDCTNCERRTTTKADPVSAMEEWNGDNMAMLYIDDPSISKKIEKTVTWFQEMVAPEEEEAEEEEFFRNDKMVIMKSKPSKDVVMYHTTPASAAKMRSVNVNPGFREESEDYGPPLGYMWPLMKNWSDSKSNPLADIKVAMEQIQQLRSCEAPPKAEYELLSQIDPRTEARQLMDEMKKEASGIQLAVAARAGKTLFELYSDKMNNAFSADEWTDISVAIKTEKAEIEAALSADEPITIEAGTKATIAPVDGTHNPPSETLSIKGVPFETYIPHGQGIEMENFKKGVRGVPYLSKAMVSKAIEDMDCSRVNHMEMTIQGHRDDSVDASQYPHQCKCGKPGFESWATFECSNPECKIKDRA